MTPHSKYRTLTNASALSLGLLLSALMFLSACALAGSTPAIAKGALCAVHNSSQMINLCEDPVRK